MPTGPPVTLVSKLITFAGSAEGVRVKGPFSKVRVCIIGAISTVIVPPTFEVPIVAVSPASSGGVAVPHAAAVLQTPLVVFQTPFVTA